MIWRAASYEIALGDALEISDNSEKNLSLMVPTGCPSHLLNLSFNTNIH